MAPEYVLAIGALIGSFCKSWVTRSQDTFSSRTVMDIAIGGVVGLLYPLYPIVELKGTYIQQGAQMFVLAYFASDLLMNVMGKLGVKLPDSGK